MNMLTLIRTRIRHRLERRLERERFTERRLARFRRLVVHARNHSPYYRDVIARHGIDPSSCTPEDFPALTKGEVMANFDELVTDRSITKDRVEDFLSSSADPTDLLDGRYYVLHTSGSSGEIGLFVYSRDDIARGMAQTPTPPFVGPRRVRTAFFGATGGHFAGATFASLMKSSALRLLFRAETFEINSPLDKVRSGLNRLRPDVVAGYATALRILADEQTRGGLDIAPRLLLSSGEPLSPNDRSVIESTFGAPLLNAYMCTEHAYMGFAGTGGEGMYLMEDDLIFEFHDDHTCITNLFNYTMPLIRYRMDDILAPVEDMEKTLPFTRVREIIGRSEYIPYFTDRSGREDFISPHIINELFVRNLKRFQLRVVDKGSFVFRAVAVPGISPDQREEMLRAIRSKLMAILAEKELDNVSFEIEEVDDLPVDRKTGKFRLIIPAEE